MQYNLTLTLLHVQSTSWTDKKTRDHKTSTRLFFTDESTRVYDYKYEGSIKDLVVGVSYVLVIKPYNFVNENGKPVIGSKFVSLTPVL